MSAIDRRTFLGAAATVTILPRHVLAGSGEQPPSEKLNIAAIGVGGQGAANLRAVESENIVALCDVDWKRAAGSFARYPQARRYRDFRVMLDKEPGIDAVIVATPDHTHAVAALAAIQLGKHVYVEKPLTYSIAEARQLTEAARAAGVATQMGNHGHAAETMRLLKEWLDDGAIGPVHEVAAFTPHAVWPQGMPRPSETPPVPDDLAWDLWLGPAPRRPYHPAYAPVLWRGWWDFGTGALGDMGCHILDPLYYAFGLMYPERVEASCSTFVPEGITWNKPVNDETYPRASIVHYRFPAQGSRPPLKVTWYDGGLMPERPDELEAGRRMGNVYGGLLLIGEKGKIICGAHGADGLRLLPESLMRSYARPAKRLPRSPGHHQEWIDACKGRGRPGSNFDYAGPLTESVLLGNVAIRVQRPIGFDPEKLEIPGDEEANRWLQREARSGW
jgi:predicted dehydrogenase